MRVVIVTDAWLPQTNGVVRTLSTTVDRLRADGIDVHVIAPDDFRTGPCPTYPEIRLALLAGRAVGRKLRALQPAAVHVATEGPLGLAARNWCLRNGYPFTSAYHTQFPEYIRARAPVPLSVGYAFMRWFHNAAARTLVATPSMRRQLEARGLRNITRWSRGVDSELFRPLRKEFLELPRPIWLYVGRVAVEKGIEDFLGLDLPGTKLVVGDGPARATLEVQFPRSAIRRLQARRGPGPARLRLRRLRLPEPYGHVRPRACWRPWPAGCRWRRTRSPGRLTSSSMV